MGVKSNKFTVILKVTGKKQKQVKGKREYTRNDAKSVFDIITQNE